MDIGSGKKDVEAQFKAFDTNRNGKLSMTEFLPFMQALCPGMQYSECRRLFDEADKNHSDSLGMSEFSRFVLKRIAPVDTPTKDLEKSSKDSMATRTR